MGSGLTTKLGRMARIDLYDPSNSKVETIAYAYDLFGRTDTITETEGSIVRVTDMDYDIEGRVVKITRPEGWIAYGYDDATSWHTKTWTANSEWSYEYDVVGRLDVVTDVGSNLSTDYDYDTIGNVSTITVSQGVITIRSTTHTYDPLRHWLTKIEHKDGSGVNLSTFDYVRRADGQILQVGETVKQPDNTFVVTQQNYTYDALNRLTKEVVDTSVSMGDFTNEYVLDLVGNRTEKIDTKEGQSPVTTTYSYNARDQLLSETDGSSSINYGYDSNGSLTSQSGGGSSRIQSWDVRGRLKGATVDGVTTSYEYTPDGIRSSITEGSSTTDYIIDGMTPSGYAQVVEELDSGLSVVRYTYGSSLDPISEYRGGNDAAYLGDGHSGVRQAVGASGVILLVQRFDAVGQTVAKAGVLQTAIGYRGERFDATLGQYYLRARFYDPTNGRFTGMDPFAGTYSDPLQTMRYGYASANAIFALDPSGKATLGSTLVTSSVIGGLSGGVVGYIKGGLRGAISGLVLGAIMAPIMVSLTIGAGIGLAAVTGLSATTAIFIVGAIVTGYSVYSNGRDLVTAKTSRERWAAGVSLAISLVTFGYGARQFSRIPSLPNNAAASNGPVPNSRGNWGVWLSEFAALMRGESVIGREVYARPVGGGARVRFDLVLRNIFTGRIRFVESKFGPNAGFTPNQRQSYPNMLRNGGIIETDALAGQGVPRNTQFNPAQLLFQFWNGANPNL